MSIRGQQFKGLLAPSEQRSQPLPQSVKDLNFRLQYLRDSLNLTTWLCLGVFAGGFMFLAFGSRVLILPAVWLGVRAVDIFLMANGLKHKSYMNGVIPKKTATAFPDAAGNYGNKPADSEICVFILGTRCNHPLGALAPGMAQIRAMFPNMNADLAEHREEYGFLTSTAWLSADQSQSGSELMNVLYFKNVEGLHKFAAAPIHRDGWNWFNKHTKAFPHLSIWHETYQVPKGSWESIYINSHISGINGASIKYTDEMSGKEMYEYPIVDASKGLLKTSACRMSRSNATEHDGYGEDPYQNQ